MSAPGYGPPHILVVDDEIRNRELLEVMLTAEKYRVTLASSGIEALDMVEKLPPDLILLDVMMPGMDGYQVATKIKSNAATAKIPIIMVTALSSRDSRILGLSAGAEDFLSKPIDRAELSLRVKSLLRLKSYADHYDNYSQVLATEVALRTAELVERTEVLEKQARMLTQQSALLDLAQDAIMVQDMSGHILFWSAGATAIYGWTREEALGAVSYVLLDEESTEPRKRLEATLLLNGRWEGEVIRRTREGRRITIAKRLTLQRDAAGDPVQVLSLDTDVTEQRRTDAERQALTERLSLATAVARIGVWEWDRAANSLTWDATMFDIYGLPSLVPLPYEQWTSTIFPEDLPNVEATRRRVIDEKRDDVVEFRIVRQDGAIRNVAAVEKVVLDASLNVLRVVGVNMDITERKLAERALESVREEEMRFKDDFLSHVSHELRSPLTAIKQFTSILINGLAGDLNEEQRQYEGIVLKNVHQLQSMIDDLLEVTRLETGKLTIDLAPVSVQTVAADAIQTLALTAASKGVDVSCELPEDLPSAYADPTRLLQILIILLDNAVKFTPAGGSVRIRARVLKDAPDFLQLEVADTGCGIAPELSGKLFDRLFQVAEQSRASRKGLGLGLYICRELVVRQGGTISVASRVRKGSTFSFTLPLFSMSRVIAPLIKNGRWPAESAALLTLHLRLPGEPHSSESNAGPPHEARTFIRKCLLPDLDLLLPTSRSTPQGESFFVAVFADEKGRAVLTHRIREQFHSSRALNRAGRTLSLSYDVLPAFAREVGSSMEQAATDMASSLEDAVQCHLLPQDFPS